MVQANTWLVGPTRNYKKPSSVSTLVQNSDTVAIDAGIYLSDTARWSANNLVLKGVGGMAHLKANGASFGGKAIWVITGNNILVQYIEFSLCTCASKNGAGIRQEGINLTVQHCYFHDNENGILAGDNVTSNIVIEYSEFYNNGFGDGYTHNLYINHVNSLLFQYNYSHHAVVGHELKSRAYNNYILYNRIANEATGNASRNIDLPNGGLAIVIGNEIHQGTLTQNSNMVGYGLEGLTNPTEHQFYFVNNTLVNEHTTAIFVSVQNSTALCKMTNNIFAGNGSVLSGTSLAIDTSHNLHSSFSGIGIANASAYDYHLLTTSCAINKGISPGFAGAFSLYPIFEYIHPFSKLMRANNDTIDIGAHEFGASSNIKSEPLETVVSIIYPNPAAEFITVDLIGFFEQQKCLEILDMKGSLVYKLQTFERRIIIPTQQLCRGVYLLKVIMEGISSTQRFVIK